MKIFDCFLERVIYIYKSYEAVVGIKAVEYVNLVITDTNEMVNNSVAVINLLR